MEKVNFSKFIESAKIHAGTMARGFARTVFGALVTGLMVIAIYGFVQIGSESGYIAVCDFIASCATLSVALCNVYMMGRKKKGAKK